jgi:4-amino-4-deoxy-L-arabinose transferase-like glycosyltransferase
MLLTVDHDFDGYSRFIKGIDLLSNPYDLGIHWVWLPLFQYLAAAFYWLTKSYVSVRVFSTVCGTLSLFVIYKLAFAVFEEYKLALMASSIMALNPLIFIYDTTGMTESFFTLLLLSATYFFVIDRTLFFSLLLGLACLVRYEAWFITPIFYVFTLFQKRQKLFIGLVAALIPFFSIFVWLNANRVFYGDAFSFFHSLNKYVAFRRQDFPIISSFVSHEAQYLGLVTTLAPLWYIIVYFIFLTPQVFSAAFGGMMKSGKKNKNTTALMAIASSYIILLTLLTVGGTSEGWIRHSIPAMPFLIVYASHYVRDVRWEPKSFVAFTLVSSLIILSIISVGNQNAMQPTIETSNWLRENADEGNILCVNDPIIILSHLPRERFIYFYGKNVTQHSFQNFLASNNIKYVVSECGTLSYLNQNSTITFVSREEHFVIYAI